MIPNIHPYFVHFPIVLLILAFFCEVFGQYRHSLFLKENAKWCLSLGTLALAGTIITGWIPQHHFHHGDLMREVVQRHQIIGYFTLLIFSILLVLKLKWQSKSVETGWIRILYLALFLAGINVLILGAYFGHEMVFRYGVGVSDIVDDGHAQPATADKFKKSKRQPKAQ
ncbi:MAG: putative membrane protein [Candidatus Marinamargulisbacteria bacterium]|jgi:uncharacterized membrane protein